MFNMLRLAEVETDKDERPLNAHKVRSTEVNKTLLFNQQSSRFFKVLLL